MNLIKSSTEKIENDIKKANELGELINKTIPEMVIKELEKIKFDRAYSSTSRRAIKTIEPIVEKQNLKIENVFNLFKDFSKNKMIM